MLGSKEHARALRQALYVSFFVAAGCAETRPLVVVQPQDALARLDLTDSPEWADVVPRRRCFEWSTTPLLRQRALTGSHTFFSIASDASGKLIALRHAAGVSIHDATTMQWVGDLDDKLPRFAMEGHALPSCSLMQGFLESLALSPDGRFIAVGADRGEVKIWDLQRGTLVVEQYLRDDFTRWQLTHNTLAAAGGAGLVAAGSGEESMVDNQLSGIVAFSSDLRRAITSNEGVQLLVERGAAEFSVLAQSPSATAAFSPSGKLFALWHGAGPDNFTLEIWNSERFELLASAPIPSPASLPEGPLHVAFDRTERHVIVHRGENQVAIYAIGERKTPPIEISLSLAHPMLGVVPHAVNGFVVGDEGGNLVHVTVPDGSARTAYSFQGGLTPLEPVRLSERESADLAMLAYGVTPHANRVVIWALTEKAPHIGARLVATKLESSEMTRLGGLEAYAPLLSARAEGTSTDGSFVVQRDCDSIMRVDSATGASTVLVSYKHEPSKRRCRLGGAQATLSPTGKHLVVTRLDTEGRSRGELFALEPKPRVIRDLPGNGSLAFSRSGRFLARKGAQEILVFDLDAPESTPPRVLSPPSDRGWQVRAVSDDGARVAVSDGHTVTYQPAGTAPHGIQIHAAYVSMTPDGDVIIASSRERTELLRVSDGARVMLRAFVDEREQIQWLAETAEGVFSASPAIAASRAYRSGSLFDGRLLTPGEVRRRYERTNLIADLMAGRAVTPLP